MKGIGLTSNVIVEGTILLLGTSKITKFTLSIMKHRHFGKVNVLNDLHQQGCDSIFCYDSYEYRAFYEFKLEFIHALSARHNKRLGLYYFPLIMTSIY